MEEVEGSSRIFIQGLPPYADEKRIRQLFGKRGDVTDVKVIRTKWATLLYYPVLQSMETFV